MQKNTYGKFATAEELLRGYNALQQAFTQKCQQLAELNKQVAELSSKQAVDTTNQVVQGGASFDKTNNDITYGNASPKQNGTSVLPNVDGTNGTSPAFIVEERSPNPQTNVPDKNDILASFGAQQNNAKSGTNETSPLTSNGQSICPTVNTTDKDNVVQTIVDEGKATAVVPTADCEESSLRAAKENAAPTSNVSEQNAVRNNAVNAQQSSNNADCNGDKKMHTYQEICDKSASNTAVNDGAESTQKIGRASCRERV